MDYKKKLITVEEALKLVKSGDHIFSGMMAAEARLFLSKLHELPADIKDVKVTNCLPMLDAKYFTEKEYADRFTIESWFFSGALRKAFANGNIHYIPNHLHLAAHDRLTHTRPDIYVGVVTPPDKNGFMSLSLSNVYEKRMLQAAKMVILEINPNFPRTHGDVEVHVDDVDYLIETDYPVPELPDGELTEKDIIIGNLIAERINDGDCLQLGIGGIPNAVAAALVNKKDLGVHTEMLTTGFMKLYKAGAITGKYKKTHPGKMVAAFALGTRELYDFIDDNPAVEIRDGKYVNDPHNIGLNDNQVSINSTIEIDLTGQCCSEAIGTRQFSGTGGQVDTAVGAQNSKGGRSFIALYSTAMVRNKETGEREEVSKIVPVLKPGAPVTLSRNDVDYVVTEYGVVRLTGTTITERVERLISIAHPKFREQLMKDAIKYGLHPGVK
ncbi:MAG: acetyl-CoA hydrolase/transferase C-terminal domain-containing protein [Bacillota bacterium]|nr:acetyl-CoA hydrolase/transferase C-terminal domain-containing protein [Bacillota bacterium]